MQVVVTFRHFEANDAVRSYAKEKILKLKKYLERPVEARVVLSMEKFRAMAEATITGDGYTINGAEKTDDMYSAIDKLVGKLERQILKRRGKTKPRRSNSNAQGHRYRMNILSPEGVTAGAEKRVIRSDEHSAKPMSLDEAILRLNAGEDDFFVFTDLDSGLMNVVYRRKDGNYGLIESEVR
ncbi:MAG: ribosome-associated translation inhibitor RaiA [Deltaproteobacteria bacterium]|nr:ribosome-associated translation inhibitor RaiA [Deltaproteobacteria bacterium]MBW2121892.1 ribosome-associated translation inhibitor RaiA [Deltaproteobacteria bacterium]